MNYVEYLEARSSQIGWDTGVKLESLDEVVTLDLKPVSGSGVGDAWYAYLSDGEEKNLLLRVAGAYQVQPTTSKGYAAMFGNVTTYKDGNITGSDLVVNSRVVAEFSKSKIKIGSKKVNINASVLNPSNYNIIINAGGYKNGVYGNLERCQSARYYEFKIMSGDTTVIDLKPAVDDNNVPCFYDEVTENVIYSIGSGTPTAGPVVGPIAKILNLTPNESQKDFPSGSETTLLYSQYDWSLSSCPSWISVSPTSGTSGNTTVSFSYNANKMAQRTGIVEFVNTTGETASYTLTQSGSNSCFINIGSDSIDSIKVGGYDVEKAYIGSVLIYEDKFDISSQTAKLYDTGSTYELTITSVKPWELSIDSAATWLSASTLSGNAGINVVTLTAVGSISADMSTIITASTANKSATCSISRVCELFIGRNNAVTNSYIDIGTYVDSSSVVEITGKWRGVEQGNTVVGYTNNYDTNKAWRFFNYQSHPYLDWGNNRITSTAVNAKTNGLFFSYRLFNYGIHYNITDTDLATGNYVDYTNTEDTIKVDVGTIWMKEIKIYRNNQLVFFGYGKNDGNHIGIYDEISQTMYYNGSIIMSSSVD